MAQKKFIMDGGFQASSDSTIEGNLVVNGELLLSGTSTTVNTVALDVENHLVTLNSTETGTPSLNASLVVERGTEENTSIRWNEENDKWELTNDGINFKAISTTTYSDSDAIIAVREAGYALESYVDDQITSTVNQSVSSLQDNVNDRLPTSTSVVIGDWTVSKVDGNLLFSVSGAVKMKLDVDGNLEVAGNVSGYVSL